MAMTDLKSDITEGLTTEQAAARVRAAGLRCSDGTLSNHASKGSGPTFRIAQGRRLYLASDVDAWIKSLIGQPARRASEARLARAVAA